MQLNVMNARSIALIAGDRSRWALAGDQLYIDLDLGGENLPPGTQLEIGSAVIEVTDIPHRGCKKFVGRFGLDAMKFVNSETGVRLNLRGINAKIIKGGTVRVGDRVRKVGGVSDAPIRIERRFDAPVSRVFRALANPKDQERWAWGSLGRDCGATIDFRPGGAIRVTTVAKDGTTLAFHGVYSEIRENELVSHSLVWDTPMPYESPGERVTYELTAEGGGTKLTFAHEGVPDGPASDEHVKGWNDVFDTLDTVVSS